MAFDNIFASLGQFGYYQKRVYLMQCLPQIFSAIQTCLSLFILFQPEHRCHLENYKGDSFAPQSDFHAHFINTSIPISRTTNQYGDVVSKPTQCQIFDIDPILQNVTYQNGQYQENATSMHQSMMKMNTTLRQYDCNSWVYDKSVFTKTFVTQNNLVCRRKSMRIHAIMAFMAGFTFGSFVLGVFSDIMGRKKAMIVSIILYIIPNTAVTFTTDFVTFVILRFLSGVSVGGLLGVGFVIGLEYVGPTKRMWAGIVIELFWALGMLLLALLAYFIRDWQYLNLVVSIPPVLFLSYIWIMPESVRWLLTRGKKDEAVAILRQAAKVNGVRFDEKLIDSLNVEHDRRVPLWQLFSSPRLALQSFIIFFNWMMCSMLFYGLSFNVGNISGNIFLNFFLVSLAEVVGFSCCLLVLNRFGRRVVYVSASLCAGVICISTIFPSLYAPAELQWVSVTLASIGKVFASAAFATVLLFTAELYPTVVRNSAMGTAAFFARIGGMMSPYIVDLAHTVHGDIGQALPMIVFGLTAMLAACLAWKLPETVNTSLPETLSDTIREPTLAQKIEEITRSQDIEIRVPMFRNDEEEKINDVIS